MKKIYQEKPSEQTIKEIKIYLSNNPGKDVSYANWKKSLELRIQLQKELIESVSDYKNEFNEIIEFYQRKTSEGVGLSEERVLYETNRKLSDLHSRYVPDSECQRLLKELESKTYDSSIQEQQCKKGN